MPRPKARAAPVSADEVSGWVLAVVAGASVLFLGLGFEVIAGWALAFVVGDVLRIRRTHVEAAMARAGIADPGRTARAMYASLGRGVVELVYAALTSSKRATADVRVPAEFIDRLRQGGRGAVIATAHTGNWDLVGCAIAEFAPLTVVTKHLSVRVLDAVWQRARLGRGVDLVQVGDVARRAKLSLRNGNLFAMMIDQAPERRRAVVATSFLGEAVWVDLSPALLAARFRVPLVAAFPERLPDGSLGVEIAGVRIPPKIPSREWAERAMIDVTRSLEDFVRRHPEQWLWMHRRWKDLPEGRPELRGRKPFAETPALLAREPRSIRDS